MLEGGVVVVSCSGQKRASETTPLLPPKRPRLQTRPRLQVTGNLTSQHPSLVGFGGVGQKRGAFIAPCFCFLNPSQGKQRRRRVCERALMNITKIYISGQPCIRKQLLFLLGASPHSQSGCGVGHSNGPWCRGARGRTRAHTHR